MGREEGVRVLHGVISFSPCFLPPFFFIYYKRGLQARTLGNMNRARIVGIHVYFHFPPEVLASRSVESMTVLYIHASYLRQIELLSRFYLRGTAIASGHGNPVRNYCCNDDHNDTGTSMTQHNTLRNSRMKFRNRLAFPFRRL